ncbi:uncharacterized protein LOC143179224 [Calliopsis andreniformis]|uniref:uncharacterized protein LOC143179224 n=1 Tax=Calliopsis andreniformis TaxID=337506 RepID=UPI003FCCD7C7
MVKALQDENKGLLSKNMHTPKDGHIHKKKNQKFKQTPIGKVPLINGSKANNNSSMKQQGLEKQKSTSPQKSPGKDKEQKKKDSPRVNAKPPKNEPSKKDESKLDEDESESDEDINEGIVLEEQSFVQESDSDEDEEESDEDESEDEKLPNILGTSLADDTEEDDGDYEEDEMDEKMKEEINKGVKMFKGIKQNDKSIDTKNGSDQSAMDSSMIDDDDDEDGDDYKEIEEEEDDDDDDISEEDDDDDDESEDEEEADESTLGLKALLGNSLADDDDDEDFAEPGEDDEDDDSEGEDDENDSDEDEEEEEQNNSIVESQENKKNKGDPNDSLEELKMDKRTIFIGNLPVEVTKKQLKKEFKKHGYIETIRLRGIVAKTLNMPKKVAAITKEMHPKLKSVHAYIRFSSEEFAKAALSMNGKIFQGNYLRVDTVCQSDKKPDLKKSVFVGNLQFNVDDNTLRKHFEGCGEIESVRVIRDNKTGVGKGFGYVNFKTEDAAVLAMELNGTKISNREIRVKPCGEHDKKKKGKHGKRSLSVESKDTGSPKKLKNNAAVGIPIQNKGKDKTQNFEDHSKPQQGSAYQGQKADRKQKKGKNKLDKKKKLLAEKLTAKPKKPKT